MCSTDPAPDPDTSPTPPTPAPIPPAEPADELAALRHEMAEIRSELAQAKRAAALAAPAPSPAASMSPRETNPGGPPDIAALARHARDSNDRRALLTYLRLRRTA